MEGSICKIHDESVTLYCSNCKKIICPKCRLKYCRPDHKRLTISEWKINLFVSYKESFDQYMNQFSFITSTEQNFQQLYEKLKKLKTGKYQILFSTLRELRDNIDHLLNSETEINETIDHNIKLVESTKRTLIEDMVKVKIEFNEAKKLIENNEFETILEKTQSKKNIINKISETCQELLQFEGKVSNYFKSLKAFKKNLHRFASLTKEDKDSFLKDRKSVV